MPWTRRHLLTIEELSRAEIDQIHATATAFKKILGRSVKKVPALRGKTIGSSAELANIILDEAEVAVVPGEAFGTPGYLRLSYALSDADITEGVTRMHKLLSEAS